MILAGKELIFQEHLAHFLLCNSNINQKLQLKVISTGVFSLSKLLKILFCTSNSLLSTQEKKDESRFLDCCHRCVCHSLCNLQ